MQPFTEVNAICIPNNKRSSKMIEPLQRFLTQQVYKEHIFNVEDAIGPWEKFTRDPQEFSHPISCEPALDHEQRTIFVFWNRNSQHTLSMARALPFATSRANCSFFTEKC
jgi:hypothetical protein